MKHRIARHRGRTPRTAAFPAPLPNLAARTNANGYRLSDRLTIGWRSGPSRAAEECAPRPATGKRYRQSRSLPDRPELELREGSDVGSREDSARGDSQSGL